MEQPLPISATPNQGVSVELVDERGEVIERAIDPPGVWERAVGFVVPDQFELLAQVDPYDNTLFEHGQFDQLEQEIAILTRAADGDDAVFFQRVQQLIKRARTAPRFKINFAGA